MNGGVKAACVVKPASACRPDVFQTNPDEENRIGRRGTFTPMLSTNNDPSTLAMFERTAPSTPQSSSLSWVSEVKSSLNATSSTEIIALPELGALFESPPYEAVIVGMPGEVSE
jgi:hypothetical protein